jgi:hypothetical protein
MRRIAITGHRDLDRDTRRLIRHHIKLALADEASPIVGLTCLADGSDQIFAKLVVETGGSIEAFIAAERFADTLTAESRSRYRRLRDLSRNVHTVALTHPCPESYMQASRLMVNRADALWAVWDGKAARGYGGTADVVAYARDRAVPVKVIWPTGAVNQSSVSWKSSQEPVNL